MFKFLESIKNFFVSLFLSDPHEARKKRDLKKIIKEIKNYNSLYFKFSNGYILPKFASILYTFYQYLKPLRDLIDKTTCNENTRLAELFRDYLIEGRLDEEKRLKRTDFSYKGIKDRMQNTINLDADINKLNQKFKEYLSYLSGPEFTQFDIEYTSFQHLSELCHYDFHRILSYFNPDVSLYKQKHKPKFSQVMGKQINQELMDLYFIMAELNLSQGIELNLSLLIERLKQPKTDNELSKIKKIVAVLDNIFHKGLSPHILLCMLRVINNDPYLDVRVDKEIRTYLDVYRSKVSSRYQKDRERVIREHNEKIILKDIKSLFGNAELLDIKGYNDETSEKLIKESFFGFEFIKPMRILKSFLFAHFENNLKNVINQILMQGFFEKKAFKETFSNLFHDAQNVIDIITEFENGLTSNNEVSIITINRYLKKYSEGKNLGTALNKLIDTINNQAKTIIEENTNLFNDLTVTLLEIINDSKQQAPEIISNIKVIGGEKNQELLTKLKNGYDYLVKFILIMKNFTIIHPIFEEE